MTEIHEPHATYVATPNETPTDRPRPVWVPQPHGGSLRPFQPGQPSANPSGRPSAARLMRERIEALVDQTDAAIQNRLEANDTQMAIEVLRQLVGAPRQAVAVAAIDATPFAEDLARALAAYAVDLLPAPDATA